MTMPNKPEPSWIAEIDKAALKAIEKTNLCMKHMKYHGQKHPDCTPQERVLIKLEGEEQSENGN